MVRAAAWFGLVVVLRFVVVGCSRGTGSDSGTVAVSAEHEPMGLNLNGLNYTEVPIGDFYVNGTWGAAIPARIGSWGSKVICCVSLPHEWHPGLMVMVQWQDDNLYKKDPDAMAHREVPVEKYEYFSDGFLWVLFFPNDKIRVYASQWGPGSPNFPEGLQEPGESCPEHFTLKNSDPRCPAPDKRMKPS
ncbi:DUF3304 domain-containing protein [Paraburkholderia fungorum]|uniref:DUF3304 domain-containing protein n=1 Tax=Paraburkholderia fungorum TaxID=134537 RepID=A0A420GHI6_9BURK|nr:hypothetical protein BCY88_28725 [Paraburkholderia fungorum]